MENDYIKKALIILLFGGVDKNIENKHKKEVIKCFDFWSPIGQENLNFYNILKNISLSCLYYWERVKISWIDSMCYKRPNY